jgi:hypothetical protein
MGLGFGVKLHWGFFAPFLVIAGIVCLVALIRTPGAFRLWKSRIPELALGSLLALPLVVSFAVCNLVSSKLLADPNQVKDAVNSPFRFDVAAQKIKINSAQLFFSPIPDLQVHLDPEARKAPYASFNQWTNDLWFKNVNRERPFRVFPYDFQGVADPTGFLYFEQTVWLGFLPAFLLMAVVAGFIRRDATLLAIVICSTFFLWHLSYAAQTKYAEAIGTYYAYPAILACGGLGLVVDRLRWRGSVVDKLFIVCLSGVIITHVILDFNLLAFNTQRNVPNALSKGFDGESMVTRTSPRVIEAIRKNDRIHIPYNHWELLFWNFMRHNPHARYTTGDLPPAGGPEPLYLLSLEGGTAAGKLVGRRPKGGSQGVVFLGTTYSGAENVFAYGAGVEKAYPDQADYFLVPASFTRSPDNQKISRIRIDSLGMKGLKPDDEVEFRVVAEAEDGSRQVGRWLTATTGSDEIGMAPGTSAKTVAIEARLTEDPSQICALASSIDAAIRPEQNACSGNGGGTDIRIILPSNAPQQEPTQWSGHDYLVRWLGQRTEFTVMNPGPATKADIRVQLGINKNPKSVRLLYSDTKTSPIKVDKLLWASGPQTYTFSVQLKQGETRMVLASEEAADPLPDGRPAAMLLIGNMKAFTGAAPVFVPVKHTAMNCYCGSSEIAATSAYRSMQSDGGKAIAGLFEKKQLFELEKNAPLNALAQVGTYSKVEVKGGRHTGTTCWLPTSLLE